MPPLKVLPKPVPVPKPPPPPANAPAPPPTAKTGAVQADSFDITTKTQFEISSTQQFSKQDLDKLEANPKTQAVGLAVRQAQVHLKGLIDKGAKISITTSKGNGGQPVVTIIPPALASSTDKNKPYNVQIHYHGTPGSASNPDGRSPVKQRIADTFNQSPPTVFVLPEWGQSSQNWDNVSNTGTTADDALKGVTGKRGQLTVSAHSLGRFAVFNAIRAHGLKADRLDMQDAFYANQPGGPGEKRGGPNEVAQWIKDHANDSPPPQVRILTTRGGKTTRESTRAMVQTTRDERDPKNPKKWIKVPTGLDLPNQLFVDIHKGLGQGQLPKEPHFDAELLPW